MTHSRSSSDRYAPGRVRLPSTLLLFFVFASMSGCVGTTGRNSPAQITRSENGFIIEETTRAGLGLRSEFDRANAALASGEWKAAVELLTKVTEEAPQFTAAQINLSIAHQNLEDFESAEAALQEALALNPKHPVALNELGIVQRRMGRFDDAKASFEKALSHQPQYHYARKNLGVLCDLFMNDASCALTHYRLYLELNPEDESAEIWIADLENRFAAEAN
ncbi:MAG: tetratricopeptide repeat protein [Myxococcota bacterium]